MALPHAPVAPAAPLLVGGLPLAQRVADQAADWLTLLMSGDATATDRDRWQQWRAAHPDHERAWRHIEAVTGRFKALDSGAAYRTLSPYAGPDRAARRRRKAMRTLLWGASAGAVGLLAGRAPLVREQLADQRTRTGEQRVVTLADGSVVTLNTASAFDVRFDAQRRLLRLLAGELMIVTGPAARADPRPDPRPFLVETAEGTVRALGTRFTVRQWDDGRTGVAVIEDAVEITPAEGSSRILRAGQRAMFSRFAADAPAPLGEAELAWTRGQIMADRMRLGDFAAEFARYRPGVVRCAQAVVDLRVSGVFPLQDTERILAALPNVLPVQVRRYTRYWIAIEPLS